MSKRKWENMTLYEEFEEWAYDDSYNQNKVNKKNKSSMISCSNCGKRVKIKQSERSNKVKCKCGTRVI